MPTPKPKAKSKPGDAQRYLGKRVVQIIAWVPAEIAAKIDEERAGWASRSAIVRQALMDRYSKKPST